MNCSEILERAKADYQAAITVEPNLAGPRSNLAALLESEADRLQNQLRQSQAGGGVAVGQLKGIVAQIQKLNQRSSRLRGQDHGLLAKEIQRSEGIPGSHGLHYRFAMSSYFNAIWQRPKNTCWKPIDNSRITDVLDGIGHVLFARGKSAGSNQVHRATDPTGRPASRIPGVEAQAQQQLQANRELSDSKDDLK